MESKKPLLSICIPTYNREKYLDKCINSIVNQKWFNWNDIEIIISDNASEDNTLKLVQTYKRKYKNIYYFRNKKNLWYDRNLDNALTNAHWKFCWFMWDDEYILKWSLYKIMMIILKNKDVWYICVNADLEYNKSNNSKIIKLRDWNEMISTYWLMCWLISKNIINKKYLFNNRDKYYKSLWIHVWIILDICKSNSIILLTERLIWTSWKENRKWNGKNELLIYKKLKWVLFNKIEDWYNKKYINNYILYLSKIIPISIITSKLNWLTLNTKNIRIIINEQYKFPFILSLSIISLPIPVFLIKIIKKLKTWQ